MAGAPLRGIARRHSICRIYSPQIGARNCGGKTCIGAGGERGRIAARNRANDVHRTPKRDSLKLQQTVTCHRQVTPCHIFQSCIPEFRSASACAVEPLRLRYSSDKKIPIQPRSWIGQVRNAPRKAPISGEMNSYICRVVLETGTLQDHSSQHHFTRC